MSSLWIPQTGCRECTGTITHEATCPAWLAANAREAEEEKLGADLYELDECGVAGPVVGGWGER